MQFMPAPRHGTAALAIVLWGPAQGDDGSRHRGCCLGDSCSERLYQRRTSVNSKLSSPIVEGV